MLGQVPTPRSSDYTLVSYFQVTPGKDIALLSGNHSCYWAECPNAEFASCSLPCVSCLCFRNEPAAGEWKQCVGRAGEWACVRCQLWSNSLKWNGNSSVELWQPGTPLRGPVSEGGTRGLSIFPQLWEQQTILADFSVNKPGWWVMKQSRIQHIMNGFIKTLLCF